MQDALFIVKVETVIKQTLPAGCQSSMGMVRATLLCNAALGVVSYLLAITEAPATDVSVNDCL